MGLMDSLKGIVRARAGTERVAKGELLDRLRGLDNERLPFSVSDDPEVDVVAQWRIVDAAWQTIFAKAGLTKAHKILLSLDEPSKTVKALEESYAVSWRAGLPSISVRAEKFQGRTIGSKSIGVGYAFEGVNPLNVEEVFRYRFDVSEMKAPLVEVITSSGWDFVPVVSRKQLR